MEGSKSVKVVLQVTVADEGYCRNITAVAVWGEGVDKSQAVVSREFDLYKAEHLKGVTVEDATEALKREALRELVTQLNLHGIL